MLVADDDDGRSAAREPWAYEVSVGSQTMRLPLMRIAEDVAICLLMTIDEDIETIDVAAKELAAKLPQDAEAVCSAATLGIQVGAGVARALRLRRQYVLQKTTKIHLDDALVAPLRSVTTEGAQALRLDRRWVSHLRGKRVVFVDDVISTGGSCAAALRLIRSAGATVVGVGALLVEGDGWRHTLGPDDAALVQSLATIPVFRKRNDDGPWQ